MKQPQDIAALRLRWTLLGLSLLGLSGCGGEDAQPYLPDQLKDTPGGVYVGAFIETASDDMDHDVGGIYVNLPKSDGNVTGQMSYQQKDCQPRNLLNLSLQKITNDKLRVGAATGNVDTAGSGDQLRVTLGMEANYDRAQDRWMGAYNRPAFASKTRVAPDCLTYQLANEGQWVVWPLGHNAPAGFALSANPQSGLVQWPVQTGAVRTLVMVLDPQRLTGLDAFELQRVQPALPATFVVPASTPARTHQVVVMLFDAQDSVLAVGSTTLVR